MTKVRRIDFLIVIFNIVVTLISVVMTLLAWQYPSFLYAGSGLMLIIKNMVIVYALCTILKFVNTIEYALPNTKLMILHFVNVLVLTLVYLTAGTLYAISHLYREDEDP